MHDYVAHPSSIPVEASLLPDSAYNDAPNTAFWGLRIPSSHAVRPNSAISVCFQLHGKKIEAVGHVVRCKKEHGSYQIWVRFASFVDCYKARLGEQACQMEHWWKEQEEQGRKLGMEQAYAEWLNLYAQQFPKIEAT